jgi:uncharacterized Zn-finger protein
MGSAAMPEPNPDVIPPSEIIKTSSRRAACDGDGGALGHPKVWLEMGAANFVECPYCDRRFVLTAPDSDEDERLDPGDYEAAHGH